MLLFYKTDKGIMSISNITSAIFDLDGTLIDSRTGIINGLKDAFLKCGLNMPEGKTIPVGPPLYDTVLSVFPDATEELVEKIAQAFREAYHRFDLPVSKPFPRTVELLSELREYGIKTYIATYKPKVFSSKILEKYFKGLYIDVITPTELPSWNNTVHNNCTKTDIVKFLVDKYSIDTKKCFMAGDAITDIEAAHKNNITSIAANYGYGEHLNFAHYSADTTDELYEIVLNLAGSTKKEAV